MKKLFSIIYAVILCLTGCTAQTNKTTKKNMNDKKVLVAYFSRADENYNVGTITKGNTQILAEMIGEETKAATFHIETLKPYPANYMQCIDVAKKEKYNNARPEIKGDVKVEEYDVIFIGMPNWWGEMPMAVYTFVEKHNWQGKTIIPFATHEGSGMGGMDKHLAKACKGSNMLDGIAIQGSVAQNQQAETKKKITSWLKTLKF